MATPGHLRCGVQLKTKTCARAAWWPGGRCPQHGHGATTFEEWIRGLSAEEGEVPYGLRMHVYHRTRRALGDIAAASEIIWYVTTPWRKTSYASGVVAPEDLTVILDGLHTSGSIAPDSVLDLHFAAQASAAVTSYLRECMRSQGVTQRTQDAAAALRKLGYGACAVDDHVLLPIADAELLAVDLRGRR